MKEIISKRYKKPYYFQLVLSVITMAISARYIHIPMLSNIMLIMLMILSLISITWIFVLANPHGVIERVDDTIIIRRIMDKTVINKNDILDVFPTPYSNKPNEMQKYMITIKFLAKGKEELLNCGDIADVDSAVKKLKDLIKS